MEKMQTLSRYRTRGRMWGDGKAMPPEDKKQFTKVPNAIRESGVLTNVKDKWPFL